MKHIILQTVWDEENSLEFGKTKHLSNLLLVTYSLDIYKSEFKNSEFHVKGEWKSNIGKDQPSYQFADFFNYLLNTALSN